MCQLQSPDVGCGRHHNMAAVGKVRRSLVDVRSGQSLDTDHTVRQKETLTGSGSGPGKIWGVDIVFLGSNFYERLVRCQHVYYSIDGVARQPSDGPRTDLLRRPAWPHLSPWARLSVNITSQFVPLNSHRIYCKGDG